MTASTEAANDAAVSLTRPRRFIVRMGLFLVLVALVVVALIGPIIDAFSANPALNGLIAGAFIAGLIYVFRQVSMIGREVSWMESYTAAQAKLDAGGTSSGTAVQPVLLAPMAHMLRDRHTGALQGQLSAVSTRSILDSVAARLDESRDISRYLTGLLIFLGLLGTFWGLLSTIGAVGDTINSLNVGSGDVGAIFDDLKAGLKAPLDGMGTAFSSSLFGLAGSLVLGFLDLQAGSAQNRFFNELEDWLAVRTKLSSGGGAAIGDAEGASVPAYVAALLEQTAESLDALQRTLARTEEKRLQADRNIAELADRIAAMAEQSSGDEQARRHLASIDAHLGRMMDAQNQGRQEAVADIRTDLKLLTRTIAQSAAAQQSGNRDA